MVGPKAFGMNGGMLQIVRKGTLANSTAYKPDIKAVKVRNGVRRDGERTDKIEGHSILSGRHVVELDEYRYAKLSRGQGHPEAHDDDLQVSVVENTMSALDWKWFVVQLRKQISI